MCYPESVKRMAFLTQDYESLRFYVSMEISGALSSTKAMAPNSKLDALMAWASSLGLRNPSQKTFRTMIGIFLTLGDQHEMDVLEKHRWFNQLKISWKRICPLYPACSNVSMLPNSPENLAMEYPSVWKEYSDNHTLMPSSPTFLARLAAVERTICMCNTNSLLSPTLACSAANMFVCQGNSSAGNPSVGNPTLNHLLQLLQGMQDPRNRCNIEYLPKKVPEQPKPPALEIATTSQQDLSEEPRLADLPQRIAAPIVAAMEELPRKIPDPNVAFESTNDNDKMEDTKELETKDKAMSSADDLKALRNKVDVIDVGLKNGTGRRNLESKPKAKTKQSKPNAKAKTKQSKPKAKAKAKTVKGKNVEKKLLNKIPLALEKKFKAGCSKCRFRKGCTPSCWAARVFLLQR